MNALSDKSKKLKFDKSKHMFCKECGFCVDCGDCENYGCGVSAENIVRESGLDDIHQL